MDNLNVKIEYSQQQLKRIGLHLVSLIRDRTAKGKDKDGLPFKEYSQRPFDIPYANATKAAIKQLVKEGKAVLFMRNGKKMALIKTGYLEYKQLVYKNTGYDGTVNLMLTGRMMQDLNVIQLDNNRIVIGFNNAEMAQRAGFNAMRGREFLGLSNADLNDVRLKELLSEGLSVK